jgi:hypothetical protein
MKLKIANLILRWLGYNPRCTSCPRGVVNEIGGRKYITDTNGAYRRLGRELRS